MRSAPPTAPGNAGERTDADGAGGGRLRGHERHAGRAAGFDHDAPSSLRDLDRRERRRRAARRCRACRRRRRAHCSPLPTTNHGSLRRKHRRMSVREFRLASRTLRERIGRTADLPRRKRRERLVEPHARRRRSRVTARDPLVEQRAASARAWSTPCRAVTRVRAARAAARRAAASVTLPAPSINTSAPAGASVEDAAPRARRRCRRTPRVVPSAASGSPIERSLTPGIAGSDAA